MAGLILITFLAVVAVDVWAAVVVIFRRGLPGRLTATYWLAIILSIAAAIGMTGFFSYYSDSNTHVFGWPIPAVILQRDSADSPWLDFTGPTTLLAYPMNFVLFLFLPSVAFILLSRRRRSARNGV